MTEIKSNDDSGVPDLVPIHDVISAAPNTCQTNSEKVPITILTGFLGAGKTTLLNFIMTRNHGKKIAIVENEFGDSMETEKLIAKDAFDGSFLSENLFELKNGCVCCTVKDDLVTTLEGLLKQKSKFNYVIIETTGLANPGPVASCFWLDDALESSVYLDAVITVVDAKNLKKCLDDTHEAAQQIAYADHILLNKSDMVPEPYLRDLRESIALINSTCVITPTVRCEVDLDTVLDLKCYSSTRSIDEWEERFDGRDACKHTSDVSTCSVTVEQPVNLFKFERWMGQLLWENKSSPHAATLFRVKGILGVEGSKTKHLLQAVHDLFDVSESGSDWLEGEKIECKITFIGRSLNRLELEEGLKKCMEWE